MMRLSELMFQGVLGQSSPARLPFSEDFSRPALSTSIDIGELRDLLLSLLYPTEIRDEELRTVEKARDPRAAVVFEYQNRTFRVARSASNSSLRLQLHKEGEYQTAAKGASGVSEALAGRLGRPTLEEFRALNLWQFEAALEERAGESVDLDELGPQTISMLEEYEETLEIDRVESELQEVDSKLDQLRDRFGRGFEIEEELERAKAQRAELSTGSLDEEDYELLRDRDERLEEYDAKLQELVEEAQEERETVGELEPDPPWRDRTMWVGVAIGVAAMGVAFADPDRLRWVALVDIVGFGVAAWTLLKYLAGRERANIHKVRVESLKRREAETREELAEFREEIDHLLVHEGATSSEELLERREKAEELDGRIEELERRAEQLRDDEKFQKATTRLEELREEKRRLEERREELPEYGADLFQLENQLHALGVDPEAALEARSGEGSESGDELPFSLLRSIAAELGCWEGGELESKTRKVWQNMAEHALGGEFGEVDLEADGSVETGLPAPASQARQWLEDHPDECRVLAGTLALSIHLRAGSRSEQIETVILEDPAEVYPAAIARGLVEVYNGGAKRGHLVAFRRSG